MGSVPSTSSQRPGKYRLHMIEFTSMILSLEARYKSKECYPKDKTLAIGVPTIVESFGMGVVSSTSSQ